MMALYSNTIRGFFTIFCIFTWHFLLIIVKQRNLQNCRSLCKLLVRNSKSFLKKIAFVPFSLFRFLVLVLFCVQSNRFFSLTVDSVRGTIITHREFVTKSFYDVIGLSRYALSLFTHRHLHRRKNTHFSHYKYTLQCVVKNIMVRNVLLSSC